MRVAPPVELSPEERARLQRWRSRPGHPLRQRASAVLLASEGLENQEIARRLGLDRLTVARWRDRFLAGRLRGLEDRGRAARRGRISEETAQAIIRATLEATAEGRPSPSTRTLAERFGVSHMSVRRLWSSYGLPPTVAGRHPDRAEAARPALPWDVVGLYLRPPLAVLAMTLRPPPVGEERAENRRRQAGRLGAGPAAVPLGTASRVTAAYRSLSGEPDAPGRADEGERELVRFLEGVARRSGTRLEVAVLTVRPARGFSLEFERWRVRHPNLHVEALADLSAWRVRAIGALGEAGRRPAAPRQFRGSAELHRSLAQSIRTYRSGSAPYLWVATARELAAGDAAYRLRYDLSATAHPGFESRAAAPDLAGSAGPDEVSRAMARNVLRRYLRVRGGERVTIQSWSGSAPYAHAFVLESLRLGARPLQLYQDEATYWAATTEVPARHLAALGEHQRAAIARTEVLVSFFGPSDHERFHALPRPTLFKLGEFQDSVLRVAERAGSRAVQMAIGRVSGASARLYGVDEADWREELLAATLADPASMHRLGRRLVRQLSSRAVLSITHPNGTDLRLRLVGRRPVLSDGSVPRSARKGRWEAVTLPAGVVTVAVDESTADGTYHSNLSSSVGLCDTVGELVGGRWRFEGGRLRSYAFDAGQEFFAQSYERAAPGRERPAYLSLGLNERIHRAPLLEDQGRGTVTLNLGRNDHVGGETSTPWWAWLFLQGATVRVNGRAVLTDGRFGP
jgi:leucyl aminopeptidase (aminopeptidase T)/transposase